MSDPHEILGVPPQANEEQIRQRYLQLVREFPPDRAPERFAEIRAAYDDLRNPLDRAEKQIFWVDGVVSLAEVETELRGRLRQARLPVDVLLGLARSS